MASVNSRAELFPNRAFTPTGSDDLMMDDDPDIQAKMPLRPKRHHSSYENMSGHRLVDDTHQYEDPSRLKDEIFHSSIRERPSPPEPKKSGSKRPRKKVNETYEPVQTKERRRTFTNESEWSVGYQKHRCSKLFNILAFAGCFLGLAALAMVLMLMLQVLPMPACQECAKKEIVPGSTGVEASQSTRELWRMVKELRANVTALRSAVEKKEDLISQLEKRDLKHTEKIAELEKIANDLVLASKNSSSSSGRSTGPRGPQGPPGPPGPKGDDGLDGMAGKPGAGNMSLCRYSRTESPPFTADYTGNGQNVLATEENGYKIIGVTCSTDGTAEYNLKSQLNSQKVRQYECECRGKSSVFTGGRSAVCILHYWICPIIS